MTGGLLGINDTWISFNPHTHAGCDCCNLFPFLVYSCFNPHTHAGCDPSAFPLNSRYSGFNPHTHAGCDQSTPYSLSHYSEFQSTHPRRVWLSNITNISNMEVSIHTPTQGVTRVDDRTSMLLSVSIHTPTQGVTWVTPYKHLQCVFQSTHPRRVWRYWDNLH